MFSPEEWTAILLSLKVAAAATLGLLPVGTALAWLLAKGDDIAPIPGTKRVRYLEENVAATALQLTAQDVARLDTLFNPDNVAGTRYAAAQMRALDRD